MKYERPSVALGVGHVPGIIDELLEGLIGNRRGIDGEGVKANHPGRPLSILRKPFIVVCAHYKFPAGDPDAVSIAGVSRLAGTRTLTRTLRTWCGVVVRDGKVI